MFQRSVSKQDKMDSTSFYVITNIKQRVKEENKMGKINVRKRGKVYEYFFEGAKVNNKRTRISKSGFKTKNEAYEYGYRADERIL